MEADDVLTLVSECSDIFLLEAELTVKIEIFVEYHVNSPRIMAKIVDFGQILGSFPKLIKFNKQNKNALIIYMAVLIYFQALGLYIQLVFQPYIYCISRHCHWYVLYKIGQREEFKSACYYRARTDFLYFGTGFSQDRFFLALVWWILL